MKTIAVATVFLSALFWFVRPVHATGTAPGGWWQSGANQDEFEIGTDKNIQHSGKASAYLKALGDTQGGAGLGQAFQAKDYIDTRVRLSAYVKTKDVEGWGRLWMRVDAVNKTVAFDNMSDRKITGTADWTKYEIVLDVPSDSVNITYGFGMSGKGQVWADDFAFEVVGKSVPVTQPLAEGAAFPVERRAVEQARPSNLGFEN